MKNAIKVINAHIAEAVSRANTKLEKAVVAPEVQFAEMKPSVMGMVKTPKGEAPSIVLNQKLFDDHGEAMCKVLPPLVAQFYAKAAKIDLATATDVTRGPGRPPEGDVILKEKRVTVSDQVRDIVASMIKSAKGKPLDREKVIAKVEAEVGLNRAQAVRRVNFHIDEALSGGTAKAA